jgi:hypothetical protein
VGVFDDVVTRVGEEVDGSAWKPLLPLGQKPVVEAKIPPAPKDRHGVAIQHSQI